MVNILIPSSGNSEFFADSYYPKTLYEVKGKPMIELVVSNFSEVTDKHFVFVFLQNECDKFHTDRVVSLLTEGNCDIVKLKEVTGGALCSCLMTIEFIDNDEELIISNNDQIIDSDLNDALNYFRNCKADCGVVCFKNLHPRWSYVRSVGDTVVEAAEKRPVSNDAIAGLYYFRKGSDFIEAAKDAIRKGRMFDGRYFITASVNEMILQNKNVMKYDIDGKDYHSFYTPDKIRKFEGDSD